MVRRFNRKGYLVGLHRGMIGIGHPFFSLKCLGNKKIIPPSNSKQKITQISNILNHSKLIYIIYFPSVFCDLLLKSETLLYISFEPIRAGARVAPQSTWPFRSRSLLFCRPRLLRVILSTFCCNLQKLIENLAPLINVLHPPKATFLAPALGLINCVYLFLVGIKDLQFCEYGEYDRQLYKFKVGTSAVHFE